MIDPLSTGPLEPPLPVRERGQALLRDPLLNKGTAFSSEERDALGLRGLLPPGVQTQEEQLARVAENYDRKGSDLERYIHLAALHERNETLFFSFLEQRTEELLPIVYTPTVGEACRQWSHIFRRGRGVYITPEDAGRIGAILDAAPQPDVRVIVVTDNGRILGLGDQGAGGMGIPIGKLAIYTLAGGIHPGRCLAVSLDVGTNNPALLSDPLYLGRRKERLRGPAYDALVDEFAEAALRRWPRVLIQWEDFGNQNAFRVLERWRERALSFNDDIQGTGAVALAGILAALRARGERVSGQRTVFLGAGEAAAGIADRLVDAMVAEGTPPAEARGRIWMVDRRGLVVPGPEALSPEKARWARSPDEAGAIAAAQGGTGLAAVVRAVRPTILVGTSGAAGAFGEDVVRAMSGACVRPIILPLSNPTSQAECSPALAHAWSEGRALVATGSPFPPVVTSAGRRRVGQANNAFIFPGIGLGTIVSEARRVTDGMFRAAAHTLAGLVTDGEIAEGALYPPVARIREASRAVAIAVAQEAVRSGVAAAPLREEEVPARVDGEMWRPRYRRYTPG